MAGGWNYLPSYSLTYLIPGLNILRDQVELNLDPYACLLHDLHSPSHDILKLDSFYVSTALQKPIILSNKGKLHYPLWISFRSHITSLLPYPTGRNTDLSRFERREHKLYLLLKAVSKNLKTRFKIATVYYLATSYLHHSHMQNKLIPSH